MHSEWDIQQGLNASASQMWRLTPATLATKLSKGRWIPAPHLLYVSQTIASAIHTGMTTGVGGRIIVTMPPRHGKSEQLSIWAPIWVLEHWPWANVMLSTYGADLAGDFSRAARDRIIEHEADLSINLRPDTRQVLRWMTTEGGGMYAVGAGGPITGRGAHVLLVDDYIKNAKEAASETTRKGLYDWFTSTVFTRLEPGATIIILVTRWHPDDVVGRLLKKFPGVWTHIKLPGLAKENDPLGREVGEALWPWRYSKSALESIRDTLGPYFWKALYDQSPIRSRSGIFTGRLQVVDITPDYSSMLKMRGWDFAATQTEETASDPDWTVGTLIGYDPQSKLRIILDQVRARKSPAGVEELLRQTAESDGTDVFIRMEQEPGSAGKSIIDNYMRNILSDYRAKGIRATGPKIVRAQLPMAAIENGTLRTIAGPWVERLQEELDDFPDGAHDDQVDSLSLTFDELKKLVKSGSTWGRGKKKQISSPITKGVTFGRRK